MPKSILKKTGGASTTASFKSQTTIETDASSMQRSRSLHDPSIGHDSSSSLSAASLSLIMLDIDFHEEKILCWGDVTIYEFPMILGDHPSVTEGPPVTIDWHHQSQKTVNLELQEYLRGPKGPSFSSEKGGLTRRKPMVLDMGTRSSLLLNMGYSMQDIVAAVTSVDTIQKSRRSNMKGRYENFKQVFANFKNFSDNSNKTTKGAQGKSTVSTLLFGDGSRKSTTSQISGGKALTVVSRSA